MSIKTYSELVNIHGFLERFRYLKMEGNVGEETFRNRRYLNQDFYHSPEWQRVRQEVILRDNGGDLGLIDFPISGQIVIHHMNPITEHDIIRRTKFLLDPEYLICVAQYTHRAIHYGDESLLPTDYVPRQPYDTCPWKRRD